MTERVHPSAKPSPSNPPPQTLNGGAAPKSQLYNPTRNLYRPNTRPPRRSGRRTCCLCCIWSTIFLLALILLAAIAAGIVWLLYRPQRPSFSVSALKFTSFNLTTASGSAPRLNCLLDLSVSARNPNKKLVFFYDPISISVSGAGVDIGDGRFPAFVHGTKNTTALKAAVSSGGARDLDSASASSLSSDLKKNKNRLQVEIRLETKVRVKMGGLKTKKVEIRVFCHGIELDIPKGDSAKTTTAAASSSDAKCEVKLRIKIWKWRV